MPTEITMPQLGESVTEGTISRWLKQPGEHVEKYEALLEISTDKVDSEIPAPVAGTLLEIVVAAGTTVRVGTVLALVGDAASHVVAPAIAAAYDIEPGTVASAGEPSAMVLPNGHAESAVAPLKRRPPISPVVARMVAEHSLDIGQITGTGLGGRVSKHDVLTYLASGAPSPAAPVAAPVAPLPAAVPVAPSPAAVPTTPLAADTELVPLTSMRRAIAAHMVLSQHTAPHVTNVFEVDLAPVVAHREQHRAAFERQGVRLTYTAYFFQAVAAALRAVPYLNGRFTEQGVVLNKRVHIGMAVALQGGLIVPVLRDADEKNLLGLARAVNDLAERARANQLRPDEVQGGTFTITNHGTGGSLFGTPVINQPQSGILGTGAIVKRPIVISQNGLDAIAIRPMVYCSLTFDHRLVDGSTADAFLTVVKTTLEQYA